MFKELMQSLTLKRSLILLFLYWKFMFQIISFWKNLEGQFQNKNSLTAPLYILLGISSWIEGRFSLYIHFISSYTFMSNLKKSLKLKNSKYTKIDIFILHLLKESQVLVFIIFKYFLLFIFSVNQKLAILKIVSLTCIQSSSFHFFSINWNYWK